MSQKERMHRYGNVGEKTLDCGDDPPPTYIESTSWSFPKTVAVVGFVFLQVILISSIVYQIAMDKLVVDIEPEQIHLSLGNNDSEYYVSWATQQPADCQLVWNKDGESLTMSLPSQMNEAIFEEGSEDYKKLFKNVITNSEKTFRKYFHTAKMTVTPGPTYHYYVTCNQVVCDKQPDKEVAYLSKRYSFEAIQYWDNQRPIRLLFYGDLGLKNAQSVPSLTHEVMSHNQDLVIHNGDFAYDLETEHGEYGDEFMKLIEPIAARIPYQTSVGNHEIARNFSHYDWRFKMINSGPINNGQANNFFYSFNAGPIHFVAISTEFYYYLEYVGIAPLISQYEWLKADLEHASRASERVKRPWIVVYGHRPMYCSSRDNDDCSKDSNLLRRGLPFSGLYALEKLFYDYGVDVELYSHEHQYERFLPIYDGRVYNGTSRPNDPYHNPLGPVHLISGSAGCQEKLDPFIGHPVTGSVRQIADYGYTRIQATRCKIHFEQISDEQAGMIVDEFTMSKDRQNFGPSLQSDIYKDC